jgi:hypothetical protein
LVLSQTGVLPLQSESLRHCTQVLVLTKQRGAPATPEQSESVRHCTQTFWLHTGSPLTEAQSPLVTHWTQVPVESSQTFPAAQALGLPTQLATQMSWVGSQTRLSGHWFEALQPQPLFAVNPLAPPPGKMQAGSSPPQPELSLQTHWFTGKNPPIRIEVQA